MTQLNCVVRTCNKCSICVLYDVKPKVSCILVILCCEYHIMVNRQTLCFAIILASFITASSNILVLAQSGTKTLVIEPGAPRNASLAVHIYPGNIADAPGAKRIWDSSANESTCNMSITVEETFSLKCPGNPLTVYAGADDYFYGTLLGQSIQGYSYKTAHKFNISTSGHLCNAPIKFTINAKNLPIYGATCDVNKAALIYAVISTDCVTSPIGYFYDNNTCTQKYCNAYLPGCTNCLSTTTCSSCRSTGNWQLVSAVCQCIEPYVSMHGCRDCITAGGSCASCDSTLQFKLDTSTGKCVCKDGYALDSNKFCIQCQSPNVMMIGCLYCVASGSACPQCSFQHYFELNPATGSCVCSPGYYFDTDNKCKSCTQYISNCAICSSNTSCTTCRSGYYLNGSTQCITSCGDGLLRGTQECDDGNNIQGDGCSPTCQIQQNFQCVTLVDPTECSYAEGLTIKNYTIMKDPIQNSVTFTFSLGDNWPFFKDIDFGKIFKSNGSLSNPSFNLSESGILTMTYTFAELLEGKQIQFVINPSLSNQTLYKYTPHSYLLALNLSSPNNIPIRIFNDETYQIQQNFDVVYKVGLGISYGILVFGMLTDKVIGVELFGAWQTAFFSLATIDKIQPLLSPLMNLSVVNGINYAFDFPQGVVPERVSAINYSAAFLSNCNFMFALIFADIVLGFLLIGLSYLIPVLKDRLRNYGRRLLKQFFIMLVAVNSLNIGFSAGLQFTYNSSAIGKFVAILCLMLPITAMFLLLILDKTDFGQFVSFFKTKDITKERYFIVAILFRITIGLILSLGNQIEEATIISFFVGMIFTMYLWGSVPFKKAYHNYRSVIAQLCVMAGLLNAMFYRSMKSTTSISLRTGILGPAYLLVILLFICILISLSILIYEIYNKYTVVCSKAISSSTNSHKSCLKQTIHITNFGQQDSRAFEKSRLTLVKVKPELGTESTAQV